MVNVSVLLPKVMLRLKPHWLRLNYKGFMVLYGVVVPAMDANM